MRLALAFFERSDEKKFSNSRLTPLLAKFRENSHVPGVTEKVFLARMPEYESGSLSRAVGLLLDGCAFPVLSPGTRVVVKPNFVSLSGARLACTDPRVAAAACAWLIDHRAKPVVADSPAFGTARAIARATGLTPLLKPLGVPVKSLGAPRPLTLTSGQRIGLSRTASEADLILNVPRLKAHCQMRVTASVKNLFGCVTGWRKAVAHARFGDSRSGFAAMILDILAALPPVVTLLDAVRAMHVTGPIRGEPFPLGLLAASANPVALDTALYGLLGLRPDEVPLWAEAKRRGLSGADPGELDHPLETPDRFDVSGFELPAELDELTFAPLRVARGRFRNLLANIRRS